MHNAMSYACGKVAEAITKITDEPLIKDLISDLTKESPSERISIETAVQRIIKMGDNSYI